MVMCVRRRAYNIELFCCLEKFDFKWNYDKRHGCQIPE